MPYLVKERCGELSPLEHAKQMSARWGLHYWEWCYSYDDADRTVTVYRLAR